MYLSPPMGLLHLVAPPNLHALEVLKAAAYNTAVLHLHGLLHGLLAELRGGQHDLRALTNCGERAQRKASLLAREQDLVRRGQVQAASKQAQQLVTQPPKYFPSAFERTSWRASQRA